MGISTVFQKRILELVEESDKTRTKLRTEMNLASYTFSNALNYGIVPRPKTLITIADYFDVSVDYLIGRSDDRSFTPAVKPSTFAERFEEMCSEHGSSHYKVGTYGGFDKSLIVRWLNDGFLPSLENLELICDYFGVSADYALGRTDFKN